MLPLRLRRQFVIFAIALLVAEAGLPLGRSQNLTNSARAASAESVFVRQAARKAGFIFSGTVLSVQPVRGGPGAVDRVRITFAIHQAVRGVRPGGKFILDEWAGMWTNAAGRFRPGDRVFLLLYPRSKLGLTSIVAGGLGRYDLDSSWRIVGTNQKPGIPADPPQRPGTSRPQARGNVPSANIIRPHTE